MCVMTEDEDVIDEYVIDEYVTGNECIMTANVCVYKEMCLCRETRST